MDIFENLNSSQKEAVFHSQGSLLVLAGAGSGKTRVITSKIAYLISQGVDSSKILAITFTNKAAKEMKERLSSLQNQKIKATISTFHALGLEIIKEEYELLELYTNFSIFNTSDQESVLKEIYQELTVSEEEYPLGAVKKFISNAKNNIQTPEEVIDQNSIFQSFYASYEKKLKSYNAVDFDDLIFLPIKLFLKNKEVLKKWASRYHYVLVDEYQDSNYSQYYFVKMLSSVHKNICAVGDDDQSIYGFRGADVGNILRFQKDFPQTKVIVLDINYRNTSLILRNAYKIIEKNPLRHSKNIRSSNTSFDGDKIILYKAEYEEEEGKWIASSIFDNRLTHKIPYQEQAILCRTNAQMRVLERCLRQDNIPYIIIGGFSFFDRSEVKTVFAYLKLLYNFNDAPAFYRAIQFPKRGIGAKTLESVFSYAMSKGISCMQAAFDADKIPNIRPSVATKLSLFAQEMIEVKASITYIKLEEALEHVYETFQLRDALINLHKEDQDFRLRSLDELVAMARRSQKRYKSQGKGDYSLKQFLQDTMLLSNKDEQDEKDEGKVFLITIHSAKGLEYQAVFIPGLEEGERGFPHEKSLKEADSKKAIEEERRLCYVAFTRAKKKLFLSYSEYKLTKQESRDLEPSRFLDDLEQDDIQIVDDESIEREFQESGGVQNIFEEIRKKLQ